MCYHSKHNLLETKHKLCTCILTILLYFMARNKCSRHTLISVKERQLISFSSFDRVVKSWISIKPSNIQHLVYILNIRKFEWIATKIFLMIWLLIVWSFITWTPYRIVVDRSVRVDTIAGYIFPFRWFIHVPSFFSPNISFLILKLKKYVCILTLFLE